jgi:hypothetical protein
VAGGGGVGGQPTETLDRRERRNQVGLLLLNGALERTGNTSPLVTLARFTTDIIRYIADLSALEHPQWIPQPQPRETRQLRRLVWQLQRELNTSRVLTEEAQLAASEASRDGRRATEREAAHIAALATARELHPMTHLLPFGTCCALCAHPHPHPHPHPHSDHFVCPPPSLQDFITETKRYIKRMRKDHAESEVEWQLYANRLENDKADAMREMDCNRRGELAELARLRDEARSRTAELDDALTREREASRRVRDMRGGTSWLEARRVLESERDEAKQRAADASRRRTLNQKRMSEANLAEQRANASTDALHKHRSRFDAWWRSDEVAMADDQQRLAAQFDKLVHEHEAEVAALQHRLSAANTEAEGFKAKVAELMPMLDVVEASDVRLHSEATRLRLEVGVLTEALKSIETIEVETLAAIACPPKPLERGHYDTRMRFMIMKLIAMANVCPTRLSLVYKIVSDYHGIILPGRERQVRVSDDVNGVRTYKTQFLQWIPNEGTCLNIRVEMGVLSQLQVGEFIIEHGGTAGNFAIHSDGASSDGTELSAFVLGKRVTAANGASKVRGVGRAQAIA